MKDVREFARDIIEISGDPTIDFKRYFETLPERVKGDLEAEPELQEPIKKRFKDRDITLYHNHNLWFHILSTKLLFKNA